MQIVTFFFLSSRIFTEEYRRHLGLILLFFSLEIFLFDRTERTPVERHETRGKTSLRIFEGPLYSFLSFLSSFLVVSREPGQVYRRRRQKSVIDTLRFLLDISVGAAHLSSPSTSTLLRQTIRALPRRWDK